MSKIRALSDNDLISSLSTSDIPNPSLRLRSIPDTLNEPSITITKTPFLSDFNVYDSPLLLSNSPIENHAS